MDESARFSAPLSLPRPRGARVIEAFSPKLARRVQSFGRRAFDLWICLEADPDVVAFCERPTYAGLLTNKTLIDFWVRYRDREAFLLLEGEAMSSSVEVGDGSLPVRVVPTAELAAARCWISNWERMLPCMVACRTSLTSALLHTIAAHVAEPMQLSRIERDLDCGDPTLTRAALFSLLHAGPLCALKLKVEPLSLVTVFAPAEAR